MKAREARPGVVVRNLDNEQIGTIARVYTDYQGVKTALVDWANGRWAITVKRLTVVVTQQREEARA